MNKGVSIIFTFSLGAAAGAVVSWRILKSRYEQLIKEETESIKEAFSRRKPVEEQPEKEEPKNEQTPNMLNEYRDMLKETGYTAYSDVEQKESEKVEDDAPCVIAPEEFGDDEDYETANLTYYADGVVTDDEDNILGDDEVIEKIGANTLTHFGEFEDDAVHVRNDKLKVYYEILKDLRDYKDVKKPYYPSEKEG